MEINEYEKIVMPINQYAQGAIAGTSLIMKQGFHPSAQIYGYLDGKLLADPMQIIYDYVDQHPPAEDLKYVIRSVDQEGNAASARIEIANWHGDTFTDFFHTAEN